MMNWCVSTGSIVQLANSTATILSASVWSIIFGHGLPILLWIFDASSKRHIFYTSSSSPATWTLLSILPLPYTRTHWILSLCLSSTSTTNNIKAILSFPLRYIHIYIFFTLILIFLGYRELQLMFIHYVCVCIHVWILIALINTVSEWVRN